MTFSASYRLKWALDQNMPHRTAMEILSDIKLVCSLNGVGNHHRTSNTSIKTKTIKLYLIYWSKIIWRFLPNIYGKKRHRCGGVSSYLPLLLYLPSSLFLFSFCRLFFSLRCVMYQEFSNHLACHLLTEHLNYAFN